MKRIIVFVSVFLFGFLILKSQPIQSCTTLEPPWEQDLPLHVEYSDMSGWLIYSKNLNTNGIIITGFNLSNFGILTEAEKPNVLELIIEKSIKGLIKESADIFNIQNPEQEYSITIEFPACWAFEPHPFQVDDWYNLYYLRKCSNNCCKIELVLHKVGDFIIPKSKIVISSPNDCAGLQYQTYSCYYACTVLDNLPTEEEPIHGPCYEDYGCDGYTTDFSTGGGIDYTENGATVKIAPKFEISYCDAPGMRIDFLGVDKMGGESWENMTVKAITKFCVEYALKFLTGHEQTQFVIVQIPCFTKTSIQMVPCGVPNCCKLIFDLYRYRLYDETYIKNLTSYCETNPDMPNLGFGPGDFHLNEVLLPDISSGNFNSKNYWRIDGNDNIVDTNNFIGPTNGADFIIKTGDLSDTSSQFSERMRVKADGKIEMRFNRWNNMPKIVFDASTSNSVFPDDPIIKFYRQTGNDSSCNTTIGIFESYPWWISVTGLNGNNEYGAFNIWNGPAACPGEEASGMVRRFTILNNGNIGIGVSEPSVKLDIFGDVKIEGLTRIKGDAKIYGTVYSNEVIVKDPDLWWSWPDYVLDDNYNLQSLNDIELYIKKYGHLPDIPSSEEIKEKGINLSEMQIIMMKKIEELTLHLIELKKENEVLKTQMKELKK
ncbi:MAG: hypothetical protein EPN82_14600 [Bacteroidetes bacterium]|nr:MAG: hypothetical protein EPN82_14600 [Bacteroidota bacterium]